MLNLNDGSQPVLLNSAIILLITAYIYIITQDDFMQGSTYLCTVQMLSSPYFLCPTL